MGKHQLMGTPSKYDAICTQLCRDLNAQAVVLMVLEGREGNGMSCAGRGQYATIGMPHVLSAYLRGLADKIDAGQPEGIGIDTPDEAAS